MSDYICSVMKSHKRSYESAQNQPPVCCGRPMEPVPAPASAPGRPAAAAVFSSGLLAHDVATVPQKEKDWWRMWK